MDNREVSYETLASVPFSMPHEDLVARLGNPEDNFVERKPEGVNASEIRRTLVAFANSVPIGATAVLFIGIHSDGRIQGVSKPEEIQKTIRQQTEGVCYPPVRVSTAALNVEGKTVLAVVVPPSENKPHFAGPAFVRRGAESVVASSDLFDELVASRNGKVAAILRMRGTVVTVTCIQHKLGSTEQIVGRSRTTSECVILECTPHVVRLQDISSGRLATEPLENVTISRDEERHRHMLVVRG